MKEEISNLVELRTALLVGVYQQTAEKAACEESVAELERLAETFGLKTLSKVLVPIKKFTSATLIGSGKVEEIAALAEEQKIDLIIFDDEITPHQQRNLEKAFKRSVMDRTELIIEVFAQRAQTREARLQIELAKVKYQMPRLRRLWTHLSRQVSGGAGYLKGEGEKQIELDRRMLHNRVVRLEKELKEVSGQRQLQRTARLRSQVPSFAIVGYTNSGKSTLLKALTKADILVEDKLFATLDTTTRSYILPNKQHILLIDTVGFIRKIPHSVIAAFKSTLEEAVFTDILLHLIDVSHPMALVQAEASRKVLAELGAQDHPMITVLNKIDQCDNTSILRKLRILYPKTVAISALHGVGFEELMQMMMKEIEALRTNLKLRIPQTHYVLVSEIMREGRVISLEYEENDILIHADVPSNIKHKVAPYVYE